jgi:predicted flap endonuclease-1-like 5' DNA nuclease
MFLPSRLCRPFNHKYRNITMTKLSDIEGIGPTYADKLKGCGVATQQPLLEKGGTPAGRKALIDDSGVSDKLILKWINRADLARIRGVGGEYADLLECSGVDTVPEVGQRNAANLHAKMTEVNEEKKLVRSMPSESMVVNWVEQAKSLPRAINY